MDRKEDHTGHETFYDYYILLSLPLPPLAYKLGVQTLPPSPLTPVQPTPHAGGEDGGENDPFSKANLKKLYRRATLKYHPDKGGNPQTFIRLKRAVKVLGDTGLRGRYDLFGLDSGLDSGSEELFDSKGSGGADGEEGDSHGSGEGDDPSNTSGRIREISTTCANYTWLLLLRTVILFLLLQVAKFKVTVVLACGALIALQHYSKPQPEGLDRVDYAMTFLAVPIAFTLIHWSSPNGWLFYLVESVGIFLLPTSSVISSPKTSPVLANPIIMLVLGVCSFAVAWFSRSRLGFYIPLLLIEVFLCLCVLFIFPLFEHLLKAETDQLLEVYAEKVREAVRYEVGLQKKKRGE